MPWLVALLVFCLDHCWVHPTAAAVVDRDIFARKSPIVQNRGGREEESQGNFSLWIPPPTTT